MSSRKRYPVCTLEHWIVEALEEQVANEEPSAHVWRRVRRQVNAVSEQRRHGMFEVSGEWAIANRRETSLSRSIMKNNRLFMLQSTGMSHLLDYCGLVFQFGH